MPVVNIINLRSLSSKFSILENSLPPSTLKMFEASSTLLHRGPMVSKSGFNGTDPLTERRPIVVFSPTKSFHAAGIRTDPPVSEPIPAEARLNATDAAAPDDEPPGTAASSFTHGGVLVIGLRPKPENANSDIWVFPKHTNPALDAFLSTTASDLGVLPFNNKEPASVKVPTVSNKSFQDTGTPSKRLFRIPFVARSLDSSASFIALLSVNRAYILSLRECSLIASKYFEVSSTGSISPLPIF